MGDENKDFKVTDRRVTVDAETEAGAAAENAQDKDARQELSKEYEKVAAAEEKHSPLPKVDLGTFILSLSSSVLVHLGEVPEPESGSVQENLDLAKHTIDILNMLEEKTRGNLTSDEERLLKDVLFELRLKYVQKVK